MSIFKDFTFIFFHRKQPKTFAFDHCFFSTDPCAPNFASQNIVFDSVGRDILENAFQGYNACIFAYGQTGEYFVFFFFSFGFCSLENGYRMPICLFTTLLRNERQQNEYASKTSVRKTG